MRFGRGSTERIHGAFSRSAKYRVIANVSGIEEIVMRRHQLQQRLPSRMEDASAGHEHEATMHDFALASALIGARARAGLSRVQMAQRMNLTPTTIAMIESGQVKPSTLVLERYAVITSHQLVVDLIPLNGTRKHFSRRWGARSH